MKKTPLAIASLIVIAVSMVFAFAGVRRGDSPQDAKVPARITPPAAESVSAQATGNGAPVAVIIAPMDTQADILIEEIPLMLSADSATSETPAVLQPAVDDASSGILTAEQSMPGDGSAEQPDANRSAQEALAEMLAALDHLSQQAAVTRESVALMVSEYEE